MYECLADDPHINSTAPRDGEKDRQVNKVPAGNLTAKLQNALNKYMRYREMHSHRFSTTLSGKTFKNAEFYLADDNFNKLCLKAIKRKNFHLGGGHFADCYKITLNDDGDPRSKTNIPEQNFFKNKSLRGKMNVCCKKIDFNKRGEANAEKLDDLENEFVREFENLTTITTTMQLNKEEADTNGSSRSSLDKLLEARHVMGCIGVYFKNDSYLLITEHFNGGSLKNWLVSEKKKNSAGNCTGNLTWKKMTQFSKQIILGLKFLESCSIVHRDIAARNICLHYPSSLADPILKIIDFGLARIVDPLESGVGNAYVANQKKVKLRQLPREALKNLIEANCFNFFILHSRGGGSKTTR